MLNKPLRTFHRQVKQRFLRRWRLREVRCLMPHALRVRDEV